MSTATTMEWIGKVSFKRFHKGNARHIRSICGLTCRKWRKRRSSSYLEATMNLPTLRDYPVPVGDIAINMASGITCKQYVVQNVIVSSVLPLNKWFLQEESGI